MACLLGEKACVDRGDSLEAGEEGERKLGFPLGFWGVLLGPNVKECVKGLG